MSESFEGRETVSESFEVWGHGANPNAAAVNPTGNSAQGSTVRIKVNNRYVTQSPINGRPTVRNATRYANETHIPLDD